MEGHNQPCVCESSGSRMWTVLASDGGGVKAYSSLLILNALCQELANVEAELDEKERSRCSNQITRRSANDALLSQYFEAFFGTSAGGLLAIMLGRLQMSIERSITAFMQFATEVFGKRRRFNFKSHYSSKNFEDAIKKILKNFCNEDPETELLVKEGEKPSEIPHTGVFTIEQACKPSIPETDEDIVSVHNNAGGATIFSSYERPVELSVKKATLRSGNPSTKIWEAARATAAAPTYFSEVKIGDNYYYDGGVGENMNNPSSRAWDEVCEVFKGPRSTCLHCNRSIPPISVFVSVGTGVKRPNEAIGHAHVLKLYWKLWQEARRSLTDTENTHQHMTKLSKLAGVHYYRFNVEDGLQDIKLNDWRIETKEKIEEKTGEYLEQPHVQAKLRRCAQQLVQLRRARQDKSKPITVVLQGPRRSRTESDTSRTELNPNSLPECWPRLSIEGSANSDIENEPSDVDTPGAPGTGLRPMNHAPTWALLSTRTNGDMIS